MRSLIAFVLGLVVGILIQRYVLAVRGPTVTEQPRATAVPASPALDGDTIKAELARTGQVIREKAREAGHAVADATANARITAEVKTKLVREARLAALRVDVDTTDGVVTLSGTVNSEDEIARAVELALATEGVHKVVSTLQVKPASRP